MNGEVAAAAGSRIQADTTLVAKWKGGSGEHKLALHYSDEGAEGETYFIGHGQDASGITIPFPQGAAAWRTADGTIWNLSWPIYSDLDLYAVYEMVDVIFHSPDGAIMADVQICKNSLAPTMILSDYPIVWATEDGTKWDFKTPVSDSLKLYAQKELKTHQISYDSNGYGSPIQAITVPDGYILTKDDLPTLEDKAAEFSGWYDQNGIKAEPGKYKVKNDVLLKARWLIDLDSNRITNLSLTAHEDSVTLCWANPTSMDFEKIKVEIRKESSSIGMSTVYIEGRPGEYIVHEFSALASGYEYDFRLYPVFKDGNVGQREKILGIPSKYVGKTAWVYGIDPPSEDRWLPETDRLREMVYWKEGDMWFDVNKTHWSDKDRYPSDKTKWADDSNLCWAAGASNTIHWWMQNNKDYIERFGKYDGPSMYLRSNIQDMYPDASEFQTSEVFQYFIDNTWDEAGYDEYGVNWFISGVDKYMDSPIFKPFETGGFFKEVFNYRPLSTMSKALGKGSMGQAFIKAFDNNMAINYTSSRPSSMLGHIMTIWGAEFDDQGYVKYVYSVDNNPGSDLGNIPGIMVRCAIDYQITPEGATHALIENYVKGTFFVIRDFRFTSLGTEMWEEYFRNNP